MTIRELNSKEEMLKTFPLLLEVYPELTIQQYGKELDEMLPHNYGQVAIYKNETCIGLTGFWFGTKIWSGKYLELDNVVISKKHRSEGAGKILFEYMEEKAVRLECNILALDSYTDNFKAHKFFYKQNYIPRGFHFIRILNKSGLR